MNLLGQIKKAEIEVFTTIVIKFKVNEDRDFCQTIYFLELIRKNDYSKNNNIKIELKNKNGVEQKL